MAACATSFEAPPPTLECSALPPSVPVVHVAPPGQACAEGAPGRPEDWQAAPEIERPPLRIDAQLAERAELAALGVGRGVVAAPSDYTRIVADLARLGALVPETLGAQYRAPYYRFLELNVSEAVGRDMESGTYPAWDCLNAHYPIAEISVSFSASYPGGATWVLFEHPIALELVLPEYAALPGVDRAALGPVTGYDGSGFCIVPDGEDWHYVFAIGLGDCAVGCDGHDYYYFQTSAAGAAHELARWANYDDVPPPCWAELCDPMYPHWSGP